MAEKKKGIIKQFADEQVKYAPQATLEELFEDYHQRRHEIYVMNLIRGIFFGFGGVIGGTIVVALLLALLSVLHYVPFLDGITEAAQQTLQNSHK
jgi:hypothetical protein